LTTAKDDGKKIREKQKERYRRGQRGQLRSPPNYGDWGQRGKKRYHTTEAQKRDGGIELGAGKNQCVGVEAKSKSINLVRNWGARKTRGKRARYLGNENKNFLVGKQGGAAPKKGQRARKWGKTPKQRENTRVQISLGL